jgi:hypothetical protein
VHVVGAAASARQNLKVNNLIFNEKEKYYFKPNQIPMPNPYPNPKPKSKTTKKKAKTITKTKFKQTISYLLLEAAVISQTVRPIGPEVE